MISTMAKKSMAIISIIALSLLISCNGIFDPSRNSTAGTVLQGMSINQAQDWISNNIEWAYGHPGSFKTAKNTLHDGFGNCGDQSTLLMAVMNDQGHEPRMIIYGESFSDCHAIVELDGRLYEPQNPSFVPPKDSPGYIYSHIQAIYSWDVVNAMAIW